MVNRRIEVSLEDAVAMLELEDGKISMATGSNTAEPDWCSLSPDTARLLAHYLEEFADDIEGKS